MIIFANPEEAARLEKSLKLVGDAAPDPDKREQTVVFMQAVKDLLGVLENAKLHTLQP